MGVTIHGPVDPVVDGIAGAIRTYADAHPGAEAGVHRYSNSIVQAWVVDPDFCGKSATERRRSIRPLLDALDDEISAELTTLLLLTPEEKAEYADHTDFENPVTFDEEYAAFQASRTRGPTIP